MRKVYPQSYACVLADRAHSDLTAPQSVEEFAPSLLEPAYIDIGPGLHKDCNRIDLTKPNPSQSSCIALQPPLSNP